VAVVVEISITHKQAQQAVLASSSSNMKFLQPQQSLPLNPRLNG
jgi:hypothetical protein